MTLPASGPISLSQVNTELGKSSTASIAMNDLQVRELAGKTTPNSTIAMSDLYGKSSVVNLNYTFSANTLQSAINMSTQPGYVAGRTKLNITVNSGIYVWSNNTTVPALSVTGTTSGDTVALINNGFIMGRGGDGGGFDDDGTNVTVHPIGNGGDAISVTVPITVDTSAGYIGGGGGGGAGGTGVARGGGGGGAGGGWGGDPGNGQLNGGDPGAIGASGANGVECGGGGGGRIMPGTGGAGRSVSGTQQLPGFGGSAGGGGGAMNSTTAGGKSTYSSNGLGGGGGWGAAGGSAQTANLESGGTAATSGAGGSAGNAGGSGTAAGNNQYTTAGGSGGKAIAAAGQSVTVTGGAARIYGIIG